MLDFRVVTVSIFAIFLLEMHVSGKRPRCYIYFQGNREAVFRSCNDRLSSLLPQSPTTATKVSLEPRLIALLLNQPRTLQPD